MGRPKLGLPIGTGTVLGLLVGTLRECGIDSVLVVLAPGEERLAILTNQAGATAIQLPESTPDMRATVAFGLTWLFEGGRARENDAFLLIPADHPALTAQSLTALLEARTREPGYAVYLPTFQGHRGHPVILSYSIAREILSLPHTEGINHLVRRHASETLLVPVDDPAILWDLDSEEDYQKLLAHFSDHD
jgi:molybdenum cofactor cytidylyltransferase